MTVTGLTVTTVLFGLLKRCLAMLMQFLAGLDRVQSLGHQSRHPLGLFLAQEAVEYRQLKSMLDLLHMQSDNLFHRFAHMKPISRSSAARTRPGAYGPARPVGRIGAQHRLPGPRTRHLYVVDTSFFPQHQRGEPALTAMANGGHVRCSRRVTTDRVGAKRSRGDGASAERSVAGWPGGKPPPGWTCRRARKRPLPVSLFLPICADSPSQIRSHRLVRAIPPATRATVYVTMMTAPTHAGGAYGNAGPDVTMTSDATAGAMTGAPSIQPWWKRL